MTLNERLKYHVSGAVQRGEAKVIAGIPVINVRAMYLDYVNDFLTVNRFAEFYSMTRETACRIIEEGRKQHEDVIRNEMENYVGKQ
jgi:tRNA 2-selenouridine synthase SelU